MPYRYLLSLIIKKPTKEIKPMSSSWYVCLVRCADNSLYTGITTDLSRRIAEHNGSATLSAKYTRSRRPVTLVYSELLSSRSEASRKEYQVKKLKKLDKEQLVDNYQQKKQFISDKRSTNK